jgi:hypothetical protein
VTRLPKHMLAWAKSAEWRAISSAQAKRNLRDFAMRPRCGAHCRTTGAPCRNPVVSGRTRCRLHGGRVGRGDQWLKPVWPDRNSPNATAKLNAKLRALDRAAQKRARRVAGMTAEERAAYERWKRDHQPTSVIDRKRKRELRRQNLEAREMHLRLAAQAPRPKTKEELELDERLAVLRAELAAREAQKGSVFD